MARRPIPAQIAPKKVMSIAEMERGVERLKERISALAAYDLGLVRERGNPPEIAALEASIMRALEKTFGEGTADLGRYAPAAKIAYEPMAWSDEYPRVEDFKNAIREHIQSANALLNQALEALLEDLKESAPESGAETKSMEKVFTKMTVQRKAFVVHGHDEGAREAIARFLERIGFQAIVLHEQANQGRTVIEKVVAHGDVGFAVVLLTPDDEGGKRGEAVRPRARQNVILELGYFVGRLGRERVCALVRGEVEIPSDFGGVVYEPFDAGGGWKQAVGRELQAAGFEVDWNAVMRP